MKIAIIGAGKLGTSITKALIDGDYDILMVDNNQEKLDIFSEQLNVATVLGDVKKVKFLKQIDIGNYDYFISCTSTDDTNIYAASSAKALGCKKVIARITSPERMGENDFICQNFNIDSIINPDMLIATEIYQHLIEKYSLKNGIYTTKRIAMIEIDAFEEPRVVGKPITYFREILPNTLVVGISRHGKVKIPHGNDIIENRDILYLVGEKKEMLSYYKKFSTKHKTNAKKIMIVGGGRTGFYLAKKLSEYGALVKIIEQDRKRCTFLSNNLKNAIILNGSGTDMQLLEEENFDKMDAFVAATGLDEENLLLSLTVKKHNVEDVISKVSHESYEDLISGLDIDVVLNPMDISASAILRIISGEKRVLSSVLLQGQAELLEIYVEKEMGMVNIKLSDLNLPEYAIIAAINRGNETIIPKGNDMILPGDHILIVCLLSHIGYIEKLLRPDNHKFVFKK